MPLELEQHAIDDRHDLIDAVAEQEPPVHGRDARLLGRHETAVDVEKGRHAATA
ncbi:Uncharacterised protein [Bordetella pertussis]|nr:Uncharacterised protein [Bordetella pertussis]CFV98675.1 Uncharacterised protein [Bordetella pertussis]